MDLDPDLERGLPVSECRHEAKRLRPDSYGSGSHSFTMADAGCSEKEAQGLVALRVLS